MESIQLEHVTCGWCFAEFDIDPSLSADLFACPGCGERQNLGALRHADLTSNAIQISHNLSTAIAKHLHRTTLAYTFVKDGQEQVGSGTLVQIGNRMLIATTAHTIPTRKDRITFVPKLEFHEIERAVTVIDVHKSAYEDVGIIEVEVDAPRLLGMEALQLDRIADLGAGREAARAALIGYPAAQIIPNYQTRILQFEGLSISCEPISPIAWGGIPIGRDDSPYDPQAHVFTHYNLDDPLFVHPENPSRDEVAPEPFGLSGGGFWQCPESREGKIWSPSMLSLFAIQSSWCKGRKHVKGVQVIHWLQLVADTYPELAAELRCQFPRLIDTGDV